MEITIYSATVYYFDVQTWSDRVVDIESTTKFGILRIYLKDIVPNMHKNENYKNTYNSDIKDAISVETIKFPRLIYKS